MDLSKAKSGLCKGAIFSINLMLMALVALLIKQHEDKKNSSEPSETTEFLPVDEAVLSVQKEISDDREAKLRSLNTDPKESVEQQLVTEEKNTTTNQAPASTAKPSSESKTPTATKQPDRKTKSS